MTLDPRIEKAISKTVKANVVENTNKQSAFKQVAHVVYSGFFHSHYWVTVDDASGKIYFRKSPLAMQLLVQCSTYCAKRFYK